MHKRTKRMIVGTLFTMSLLVGIPGCVHRTGTLYCDTRMSLGGLVILSKGISMWGSGPKRDAFSTAIGSFLTLRALLFSWWWDTLCIPYDIYLKFDGVDFYVYDQDGRPIPDVAITAYGESSSYGMEKKTDANGHLYYPRREKGFTSLTVTKEGYWGGGFGGTVWLSQSANADVPQMLKPEYHNGAVVIPTTNSMHTLNVYLKKIPQELPAVASYHLVVSNVVAGVDYGVDLTRAELCAPFGPGESADIKVRLVDEKITSGQRIRSSLKIEHGRPMVLHMSGDGCGSWPYLYYAPPKEAFGRHGEADGMKLPVLMKLPDPDANPPRYAVVASGWTNQYREPGTPACIYLRYWSAGISDNGVLVCDYWSRKVDKVVVPVTEAAVREDNERLKKQRDDGDESGDTNLESKR